MPQAVPKPTWVPVICPLLSHHTEDLLKAQRSGVSLVGLVVCFTKDQQKKNGPLADIRMKLLEERPADALPRPFDIIPTLMRAWGMAQRTASNETIHSRSEEPEILTVPWMEPTPLTPEPEPEPEPEPVRQKAVGDDTPPTSEQWKQFRESLKGFGAMPSAEVQDDATPKKKATGPAPKPAGRSKPRKPRRKPG